MHARSSLKAQAFEEYKVTRQTSTGNGSLYCGMLEFNESGIPAGFIRNELGYDGPVGTRLQRMIPQGTNYSGFDDGCVTLESMHRQQEAVSVAAPGVQPAKSKRIRETPESRRAKLQQMRMRAERNAFNRAA